MNVVIVAAVLSAAGLILAALTSALTPIVYPWFEERLAKGRLRVQRRLSVRKMIENELVKGLHDLGAVGSLLTMLHVEAPAAAQNRFINIIVGNETRFGVWLGYTIEDPQLRSLFEQYRAVVQDVRVIASQPPPLPPDMEKTLESARNEADRTAAEIVADLNRRGW